MLPSFIRSGAALGVGVASLLLLGAARVARSSAPDVVLPPAALDAPVAAPGEQVAVFSGGCFWGIQLVFEHVKGVTSAVSGYAGGQSNTATYDQVSNGDTGHAESVRVTYDPTQVSYGDLLRVFFSVAHDPTELNRQGPDVGTQYRSAIWYTTDEQRKTAEAYVEQLTKAKTFARPIVTKIAALPAFYPAEDYHQDYAIHHPRDLYIVINDAPKLERFRKALPQLYRDTPVMWTASANTK
jgi:peptide-methionine (S)-S-oxide reductase